MSSRLRKLYPAFFIAPTLALLFTIFLFPFGFAIYLSLHEYNLLYTKFEEMAFVGGKNFAELVTDRIFLNITLPITGIYTTGVVVVEFFVGLGLALIATQKLRFIRPLRIAFLMPILMSPIAVGWLFRYIFEPSIGLANYMLRGIGQPGLPWWSSGDTALLTVMLIDIWQWTPFVFLIMVAGLFAMPAEPFEAASIDGAGGWMKFRFITQRILRRIIVLVVLLRLMDALKMIDVIYVVTSGGPAQRTEGFVYAILKQSFQFFDVSMACTMSLVLLIVLNVVANVAFRFMKWE